MKLTKMICLTDDKGRDFCFSEGDRITVVTDTEGMISGVYSHTELNRIYISVSRTTTAELYPGDIIAAMTDAKAMEGENADNQ